MSDRPILYLIDGHAVAYRQFYALPENAFSTQNGEVTNAVYGFTRILIDILLEKRPKYLAVAFDSGLSGRDEYYAEYKATRDAAPASLSAQIARIKDVLAAFNVPVLEIDGYEADDIIGTISKQAEEQGLDVHIITGDRDMLQLLTEHTRVELPAFKKKPDVVYDIPKFIDKYTIHPRQLVDLKALMGDSSDNIPGIKGIGEKTGTKLLMAYDTLDGIYENIDAIKGSQHKKLVSGRDQAYLSQRLARIIRDLPLDLQIDQCVTQDFDFNEVEAVFRELEFRSLYDRLEAYNVNQLPLFQENTRQLGMFDDLRAEDIGWQAPPELFETQVVQTKDQLDALVAILNNAQAIVWDVETTSVDQMRAKLVGIALAVAEDISDDESAQRSQGYYVPIGHLNADDQQIATEFVLDALTPPLTNPDIPKYAHNAVYDLVVMQRYGIDVAPIAFDTMIAEWVRNPVSKFLGLKNFARQYLHIAMADIDVLIGSGKDQKTMDEVAIDHAAAYAVADAVATMKAVRLLRADLTDDDADDKMSQMTLLREIEMPLVPVIAEMERNGVLLDTDFLQEMSQRLSGMVAELEQEIYASAGVDAFNINSPKQLNDVLFDHLALPVEGLSKTTHGYSTNAATLDALKGEHPIIEMIIEHREWTKLQGTYVDALPQLVHPQTGRVHTSYNQTGTNTGRFSSSDPNLQNIPIRTELGREVRRAFIVPTGYTMLAVDYSQIELRVMAHISQDQTLLAAFEAGQDIHQATAATVYGIAPDEVTYLQRNFAKRVNFGLMYGMGAYRLARDSDLTLAEAQDFIKTYFDRLPGVEQYIKDTKQFARDHGYVETLIGRRRYFPVLAKGSSSRTAAAEERAAINMPIQGTAADILKLAMIELYGVLQAMDTRTKLILQVHDELVLEVPDDELADVQQLVVTTMENAYHLRVPLVANAEVGRNWRDLEPA